MISVVDCGLGNVASVANMVRRAGGHCQVIRDAAEIETSDKVILPGIGSFDAGVQRLHRSQMWDPIIRFARSGRPILGICLGMQLLGKGSAEGVQSGLDLVDARFEKFDDPGLKVPHTGWNVVNAAMPSVLFDADTTAEQRFYFVHSYYAVPGPNVATLATTVYGLEFPCAFQVDNVMGVQFHPEKSHRFGLTLMRRFVGHNA